MTDPKKKPGLAAKMKDAASRGPRYFFTKTLQKLGLKEFGTATICGRAYRVPLGEDGVHQLFADAEPWIAGLIRQLLDGRDGCFVDVGANVGQTMLICKAIAPDCSYVGFEPSSGCVDVLQKLIEINELVNTEVVNAALSNESGTATLYADNPSDPAASIVDGFRSGPEYHGGNSETVEVIDGAECIERLSPCALVKVDVEGAELEVLNSLKGLLQAQRPAVICEILPVYDENSEAGKARLERQKAIEELLREVGYSIQRINSNGELSSLETFGIHSDLEKSNYVFLPA
ncbi:MAG: FkbM family methyltransferase [Planctomycetota bacterium]|jgi:FkbM family methyltransferase